MKGRGLLESGPSTVQSSLHGPPPLQQQGRRRAPRWTMAFLRALERTGRVRAAAVDAGVDFTTVYARRKAHSDFAGEWDEALGRFRAEGARVEEEESLELSHPLSPLAFGESPSPSEGRGELVVAGGQLKRAGHDRWSERKQRIFFAELSASANVRLAAAAAGVSTQAVYARRLKHPGFARQWEAAVESGKARLQMLLIAAAEHSFDPELLPDESESRRVSVGEAIHILKTREGKERAGQAVSERGWQGGEEADESDYEAACERISERLRRLAERTRDEQAAAGWRWCEEFEVMVPPGWERGREGQDVTE